MNIKNWSKFCKKPPWLSGRVLLLKPRGPEIKSCKSQLFSVFFFFWTGEGSNPPWVYMIFSYVESNNLYHLWVFGIITDLYQAEESWEVLLVDIFLTNFEPCDECFSFVSFQTNQMNVMGLPDNNFLFGLERRLGLTWLIARSTPIKKLERKTHNDVI